MFEVETGVPLHRKVRQKNAGIPLEKLTAPDQSMYIASTDREIATVKMSVQRYSKQTGIKFSVQCEPGGCRVYRL